MRPRLIFSLLAIPLLAFAQAAYAIKVFPLGDDAAKMGTYSEPGKPTKISFAMDKDPEKGPVLKIDYILAQNSWCGLYRHSVNQNWSSAKNVNVWAKGSSNLVVRFSILDANKVSYVADMNLTPEWQEIKIPISSMKKNPYYQPPEAIQGKPLDLSNVQQIQFEPQTQGKGSFMIGPVTAE